MHFVLFDPFKRARVEMKKEIVYLLAQMKTLKSDFEVYWPSETFLISKLNENEW